MRKLGPCHKRWQRNQASGFVFREKEHCYGGTKLSKCSCGTCRCFLFFKEGGSEALSKTEIHKKIRLKTSAHRPARAFPTENFVRRNIFRPKISHCAQLRDFFRVVTSLRVMSRANIFVRPGIPSWAEEKGLSPRALWGPTHTRKNLKLPSK